MARTPSCDKSGMRKGTWTAEEDRKLIAYVTRYGCWNWRQLPKFAGNKHINLYDFNSNCSYRLNCIDWDCENLCYKVY